MIPCDDVAAVRSAMKDAILDIAAASKTRSLDEIGRACAKHGDAVMSALVFAREAADTSESLIELRRLVDEATETLKNNATLRNDP